MMRGLFIGSLAFAYLARRSLMTMVVAIDPCMVSVNRSALRFDSTLFLGFSLLANTDSFELLGVFLGFLVVRGLVGLVLLYRWSGMIVSISTTVDPRRRGFDKQGSKKRSIQTGRQTVHKTSGDRTHPRVDREVQARVGGTS